MCSWGSRGRRQLTLLQQHNPRKPIVQVPKVDATNPPLIIQLPIHVERLVRPNLHGPHPLARHRPLPRPLVPLGPHAAHAALVQRRVELVGPGGPVRVAVAVVVAEEVVAVGLAARAHGEGLVDGGEEVLG